MYLQRNKLYPWLSFDEIDMTFRCEHCKAEMEVPQTLRTSENLEVPAKEFADNHKNC